MLSAVAAADSGCRRFGKTDGGSGGGGGSSGGGGAAVELTDRQVDKLVSSERRKGQ